MSDSYEKDNTVAINVDAHDTLSTDSGLDALKEENQNETKFLFCVPLQYGHMTIGVVEVLSMLMQVVNLFWSIRTALVMIVFYHVPFLYPYIVSVKTRGADMESETKRYTYNTVTIQVYSTRLAAFVIMGLFFIIYSLHDEDLQQFFCDRYTEVRFHKLDKLEQKDHLSTSDKALKKDIEANVVSCMEQFKVVSWLIFVPATLFQIHCLFTLMAYRKEVENVVFNVVDEEEI